MTTEDTPQADERPGAAPSPAARYPSEEVRRRPAARAMLRATGLDDAALSRPFVGIVTCWTDVTPCNIHLDTLAVPLADAIRSHGGTPFRFNTISVTDGIAMGTPGMRASLISREVIADSIELAVRGHCLDAVAVIVGCDKTIPAAAMALARLDLPGIILYGGSIAPGELNGRRLTIQDVFEAVGAAAEGRIDEEELLAVERAACPGAGACGGQFTANTMALALTAMGLSPMGANDVPATDPQKPCVAARAGAQLMRMLAAGISARRFLTREALIHCRGRGDSGLDQSRASSARHRPRGGCGAGSQRFRPGGGAHACDRRSQARRPLYSR